MNQYFLLFSVTLSHSAFVRAVYHQSPILCRVDSYAPSHIVVLDDEHLESNSCIDILDCRLVLPEIVLPFGRLTNSCSLDLPSRSLSSCSSTRTYCSRHACCRPELFRENSFRRKEKNCCTFAKLSVRTTVRRQAKLRFPCNKNCFIQNC